MNNRLWWRDEYISLSFATHICNAERPAISQRGNFLSDPKDKLPMGCNLLRCLFRNYSTMQDSPLILNSLKKTVYPHKYVNLNLSIYLYILCYFIYSIALICKYIWFFWYAIFIGTFAYHRQAFFNLLVCLYYQRICRRLQSAC